MDTGHLAAHHRRMLEQEALAQQTGRVVGDPAQLSLQGLARLALSGKQVVRTGKPHRGRPLGAVPLGLAGGVPRRFARVGVAIAHAIPPRALRLAFGFFLLVTAVRMGMDLISGVG